MPMQPTGASVLIVEDEALIAADIEQILADGGFRVAGLCSTLDDALAELARRPPDLAFVDFDLRGQHSLPLAHEMKRRAIPFAFLSGSSTRDHLQGEFAQCDVLLKPFNPGDLLAVAARLSGAQTIRSSASRSGSCG